MTGDWKYGRQNFCNWPGCPARRSGSSSSSGGSSGGQAGPGAQNLSSSNVSSGSSGQAGCGAQNLSCSSGSSGQAGAQYDRQLAFRFEVYEGQELRKCPNCYVACYCCWACQAAHW